ncbi:PepSY domain-containing protein [Methylophaga sulfidovorans]|uniref:Peptidase propeptide and YPEB domain-containing protein n=1 Tax=Methylophaga sulfidovorans TaxID=45496 RepID=A0A1I3VPQ2_9GAMM|nr:PepSY domain-containing protein [Methylophaga sulfidovorans]SFJ96296.1 Peptidase propeptide and YPEB domain-containing protein [Methylophaga sulfidovorans]
MTSVFLKTIPAVLALSISSTAFAENDNYDLDDIRSWDIVKIETCLDAALDTIPGHARRVEMKMEGDDPVYEFDIEAKADGKTYNVECNAEEGFIGEIEREVDANDPVFKKLAKISQAEAKEFALAIHPGKVVASEYEIGFDGDATYEFDIQSIHGYEVKVDVDATTGQIEEANIELYEIGMEKE